MKRIYLLAISLFFLSSTTVWAQYFRFYPNNLPKISLNGTDTLPFGFTGGLEAPQFSTMHLNGDAALDLLVFDRAGNKLYPFLNAGSFKTTRYLYAPQYVPYFPALQNFVQTYDYNHDGKMDLFTSGPAGIIVYKNITSTAGVPSFEEVYPFDILWSLSRPGSTPTDTIMTNVYVANNDIPAFFDHGNDGDMDILTADPLGMVAFHENVGAEQYGNPDTLGMQLADLCWGSFISVNTILFQGCNGKYYKSSAAHNGTTLLMFDNDADGDYDLLMGDVTKDYLYFLQNGKTEKSYSYDTVIAFDETWPDNQVQAKVPFFPAAYYLDINNDGIKDLIVAPNEFETSKSQNQIITYHNVGANNQPFFQHQYNNFIQNLMLDLGTSASPGFLDVDSDGDLDLLVATEGDVAITNHTQDHIVLFENTGTLGKPFFKKVNDDFAGLKAKMISYSRLAIGDLNGDGKQDMLLGDFEGRLHYLRNIKTGTRDTFEYVTSFFDSIDVGQNNAPAIADIDKDGKPDLLCGNYTGTISYYRNIGTAANPKFTLENANFGGINVCLSSPFRCHATPTVADLDTNGVMDLLVGDYQGRLHIYPNFESNLGGTFTKLDDTTLFYEPVMNRFGSLRFGAKSTPAVAMLDSDRLPDIVVGTMAGGLAFCGTYVQVPDTSTGGGVGINEEHELKNRISVYPNPSEYFFWFSIEGKHETVDLELYNLEGKLLLSDQLDAGTYRAMIPVYELSNGMYLLSVKENNSSPHYVRVLVKHP